jgi:hypothetical protein
MTTAMPQTANAKAIMAFDMKKKWVKGSVTYTELARFIEYDNGVVLVTQPNWDNGFFSKEEARKIAANLKAQGFQFI